jgi:predicted ABC-type ATPase
VTSPFDARPIIVAVAGPNGAGKSTFFHAHLAPAGLRFINADDLARELAIVLQGGHDVPAEKLAARFPRTMENLARAIQRLPHVLVFDNSDLAHPFRQVAELRDGKLLSMNEPTPAWLPFKKS